MADQRGGARDQAAAAAAAAAAIPAAPTPMAAAEEQHSSSNTTTTGVLPRLDQGHAARHKDGAHSHGGLLTMYRRLPCPNHQHRLQQDAEAAVLVGDHCGKERASGAGSGTAGGRAGAAGGASAGPAAPACSKRASLSPALRFAGSAGARPAAHSADHLGGDAAQKYVPAISLQCNSQNEATLSGILSAASLGGLWASTASRGVAGAHSARYRGAWDGSGGRLRRRRIPPPPPRI